MGITAHLALLGLLMNRGTHGDKRKDGACDHEAQQDHEVR